MMDHLIDDKPQELFRKFGIELRFHRQFAQPRNLGFLAGRIGGGQGVCCLVGTHRLGDAKTFGQDMDQRGIDIIDA